MFIFLRFYLFIFRERGRKGEREGEKCGCVLASHTTPTGDQVHNPGMCPDWELNQWPFGSQASTQSNEPHQTGQNVYVYMKKVWKQILMGNEILHGFFMSFYTELDKDTPLGSKHDSRYYVLSSFFTIIWFITNHIKSHYEDLVTWLNLILYSSILIFVPRQFQMH